MDVIILDGINMNNFLSKTLEEFDKQFKEQNEFGEYYANCSWVKLFITSALNEQARTIISSIGNTGHRLDTNQGLLRFKSELTKLYVKEQ